MSCDLLLEIENNSLDSESDQRLRRLLGEPQSGSHEGDLDVAAMCKLQLVSFETNDTAVQEALRPIDSTLYAIEDLRSYDKAMLIAQKLAGLVVSLKQTSFPDVLSAMRSLEDRRGYPDLIAAFGTIPLGDARSDVLALLRTYLKSGKARLRDAAEDAIDMIEDAESD